MTRHRTQVAQWWGNFIHAVFIVSSIALCAVLLLARVPGLELVDIGPNWLLIWVVSWGLRRRVWQGAIAGFGMGLLQDGLTATWPSHVFGLMLAGALTGFIHEQRYLQDDFIAVMLLSFAMAIVVETVMAIQYSVLAWRPLTEIWTDYQRIAMASAILTSLWAPVLYYPFQRCWRIGQRS